jgi:hypothetical protein
VGEPVITSRTLGVLGGDSALPPGGREVADGAAANKLGVAADPAAGDAAVGDAAAADAAGGRAFMPMGMGGGQPGSEHEHRTWLTEDRDIWADPARVTPAIIG